MHKQDPMHDHDHDDDGNCRPIAGRESTSDYQNNGVRFQFPSDWTLTEQSDDEETAISLQSDGTSFWTLMLFKSRPDPEEVLETVVAALSRTMKRST